MVNLSESATEVLASVNAALEGTPYAATMNPGHLVTPGVLVLPVRVAREVIGAPAAIDYQLSAVCSATGTEHQLEQLSGITDALDGTPWRVNAAGGELVEITLDDGAQPVAALQWTVPTTYTPTL